MRIFWLTSLLALSLAAVFSLFCFPGGMGANAQSPAGKTEEELVIPPGAQDKAIQALKALGPDRGAKKISFRVVDILGTAREIKMDSRQVQKALKDLGAKETKTEIQVELPGDVLFDFDKWDIRADAEETLKIVGGITKAYQSPKVVISGHTDSKGSDAYNQKLSEQRAESVKNWLVKNAAIQPEIVTTIGCGETKPVAPNTNPDGSDNPEGRQKNRRVEIVIKKQ